MYLIWVIFSNVSLLLTLESKFKTDLYLCVNTDTPTRVLVEAMSNLLTMSSMALVCFLNSSIRMLDEESKRKKTSATLFLQARKRKEKEKHE